MGNPVEVRADIERTFATNRANREKQYIAEREDLEADYRSDLADNEQARIDALQTAGLNPDGSTPPTYDREVPVNISLPTITGTPTTGQILTGHDGLWSKADSLVYRWQRNGAGIADADQSTYTLQVADEGKAIRLQVEAHNESGTTTVFSAPVNATAP